MLPPALPSEARNLIAEDTGRDHLSHSSLGSLLNCPQRYEYSYELRLEPIAKAKPLTLGKAFQAAIEFCNPEAAGIALARPTYTQREADDLRVDQTIVSCAAMAYIDRYGAPEPTAIREYGYRVRLRNPWTGYYSRTFDLLGYADEVVFDADRDSWLLIENKLVGQITAVDIRKLPLDRQLALASYGVWRATGSPVTEVAYRFTRKPSIKQRQKETVAEYCDRIAEDYITRPDFYLHEERFFRRADDLVRVEAELWEWQRKVREGRRSKLWTRNTSVCADYGGCPYMALCLGEPDAQSLYGPKRDHSRTNPQTVQPEAPISAFCGISPDIEVASQHDEAQGQSLAASLAASIPRGDA